MRERGARQYMCAGRSILVRVRIVDGHSCGQREREGGSLARGAGQAEEPAQDLGQVFGDSQS